MSGAHSGSSCIRGRLINDTESGIFFIAVPSRRIWKAIGFVLGFQFRNLLVNCAEEETVIEKPQLGDYVWIYLDNFLSGDWEHTKGKDFFFLVLFKTVHLNWSTYF